jgi:hypothetical protein
MPHTLPASRCLAVVVVSSLVASLVLLAPGLAQTEKGKKYALLVGVRSYDHDSLPDLMHTENDVEEVGKVLARSGYLVTLLTTTRGKSNNNALPTAKNIRAELKSILDKVTKHDTILVALAGHGVQLRVKVGGGEKEEGFFCPADAKPRSTNDAAELSKTMIPLTALFQELEGSGAGVKLLLVDACRNDPKAGRNMDVDSLPRPPRGTAALFSCKSGERAFETDKLGKGHGVFFFHVLQGLEGKAKNDKGEVTWTRLAEYVTNKVSDEVPMLIGGGAKQTPHEIKNLTGKSPVLIASVGGEVVRGKTVENPGKEKDSKTAKAGPETFCDVTLEKLYDGYLKANPLLMEVTGAKVIHLKDGKRIVLGVGSAVLADDRPRTRIDAEKLCKVKALASIVAERQGVQVAHEEKVEEKTVIVLDNAKEKGKCVTEVLSITKTKTEGIVRGMSVVGRWRSKDGKVLYVAMGAICDKEGEPLPSE